MSKLLLPLLLLGWALPVRAADLAAGWQALAEYRPEQALQIFDAAAADPATTRAARFGRGITLLAKQPVDAAQLTEARGIFEELAGSGSDEPAQGARFFLARMAQHHQPQPDEALAAKHFRQLIAEYPGSTWAQAALSRLALLEIYALNRTAPPADRVAEAEKLLARARDPRGESDLRCALAEAIFYYHLPAGRALPHLLVIERLKQVDAVTRADVLVQIAEVSVLAGDKAQAKVFYAKLLAEFPRDQRHYMVQQKLKALQE